MLEPAISTKLTRPEQVPRAYVQVRAHLLAQDTLTLRAHDRITISQTLQPPGTRVMVFVTFGCGVG